MKRVARWLALALVVIVVVAGLLAWRLGPGWLVESAVAEAKRRGYDCTIARATLTLTPRSVRVDDVSCRPSGVPGITFQFPSALVDLDGTKPTHMAIESLHVTVDQTLDLALFSAHVHTVTASGALPPWTVGPIDVDASFGSVRAHVVIGHLALAPNVVRLEDTEVTALGRTLPKTDYAFEVDGPNLYGGLASRDPRAGPIHFVVKPKGATITLEKRRIDDFIPDAPPVPVEGELEVKQVRETYEWSVSTVLHGYVPPHPKELDGILFGDKTTLDAKGVLSINEGARSLQESVRTTIDEVKVRAGGLKLTGSGKSDLEHATLTLKGSVPCNQVAASAAENDLGAILGQLAGSLARRAVAGSVALRFDVDIPIANPGAARVDRSAVPSCSIVLR